MSTITPTNRTQIYRTRPEVRSMKSTVALLASLMLLAASSAWGATQTYSSNFDGAENPISEGGSWWNAGLDWTAVAKDNGIAHGTLTGTGGYNDSYARLSGFSPDQVVSAVVHRGTIATNCAPEVELLLRWDDSAHSARGYEVVLDPDGGVQFVRWNGAQGDFTVLSGGGRYYGLKEGDTFKASMVGNVISAYVNDKLISQTTDSKYATGNPGIGFFRRQCGSNTDFAVTSYTATGSDGSEPAAQPTPPPPSTNPSVCPSPG
jgi:hypothetical protein